MAKKDVENPLKPYEVQRVLYEKLWDTLVPVAPRGTGLLAKPTGVNKREELIILGEQKDDRIDNILKYLRDGNHTSSKNGIPVEKVIEYTGLPESTVKYYIAPRNKKNIEREGLIKSDHSSRPMRIYITQKGIERLNARGY